MNNISNWDYYYNEEPGDKFRANLVYTAYVSPDKKTLCMKFFRDSKYHTDGDENKLWTEELLEERFRRELKFYNLAKHTMPVADVVDVEESSRSIFVKWPGDDFYMMGYRSSYDSVLPNWREQIKQRFTEMWGAGILKFSIHPNSWLLFDDGILRPFNWFFTFSEDEEKKSINDFMIQVSNSRKDSLGPILESNGWNLDTKYSLTELQNISLESFRKNYPAELIDQLKDLKKEFHK